jgi:hypothetical protein
LHLRPSLNASAVARILSATSGLPELTGSPLLISAMPQLTAHRGKLLSANLAQGTPVHAASFIRRREIVLETELLRKADLSLIFVHELFHFIWVRLGNAKRRSYAAILAGELRHRAVGEVGESSAVRKLAAPDTRDYVCESFCDTAAWLFVSRARRRRVSLAARWRNKRKAWFDSNLAGPLKC